MNKKKLIVITTILLLVAGGIYLSLPSEIDRRVQEMVEQEGSAITRAPVLLDSASIYVSLGEGLLNVLRIMNIQDFYVDRPALEFESVKFAFNSKSLEGDGPIIIRSMLLHNPRIGLQIRTDGTNNLKEMQKVIESYVKEAAARVAATNDKPRPEDRNIIIEQLSIGQLYLHIKHPMLREPIVAEFPGIQVLNIGKTPDGVSISAAVDHIVTLIADFSQRIASGHLVKRLGALNAFKNGAFGAVDPTLLRAIEKKQEQERKAATTPQKALPNEITIEDLRSWNSTPAPTKTPLDKITPPVTGATTPAKP